MTPLGSIFCALLAATACAWLALVALAAYIARSPRPDVHTGLAWVAARIYLRVVHRARFCGLENLPRPASPGAPMGPLVVVANHTSGVDPLLVQDCCPFFIRWMMMKSMMVPQAAALWEWLEIVPVAQNSSDSQAVRTALRTLKDGGVLGVFAEGGIERPARHIMPFQPGVGVLIARTHARVLLVIIEGTPDTPTAFASLIRFSRARVRYLPLLSFEGSDLDAAAITRALEDRVVAETGWPRAAPPLSPLHSAVRPE